MTDENLRPFNQPGELRANAAAYVKHSTMMRLPQSERERHHQRALSLISHAALDHWSAPELAAHLDTSTSTMWRNLAGLVDSGAIRRLEGREWQDADRHRLQSGGRPSSRRPVLYGRGPKFFGWAMEVAEVRRGRLPARAGVRTGRTVKLHHVSLTCEILTPPSVWLQAMTSAPFGNQGQIHHKRDLEVDGLVWRVVLWESPARGFSTATITLAADSNPRVDAGQTEAAAVQLWQFARRASDALARTHGMTLHPMHPDKFFARVHAALGVPTDLESWLKSLPLESRQWRTVDGELIWADASDGPMEIESNLPDAHVLPQMGEAMTWAMRDPTALRDLSISVEAMLERMESLEARLAELISQSVKK